MNRIMGDKIENNEKSQNYVELTESQIFGKIKEDLNPIQEDLSEKRITVNEAKSELKRINDWIQGTKLEQKDKKEIGKAFEKLIKLEEDVDTNELKNEVNEIVKLVERLTQKDLANLKKNIQSTSHQRTSERPADVQQGIDKSSKSLDSTISEASEDKNPVANRAGNVMKWLNS